MFFHVNLLSVFFAALAAFAVGMAWYSPLLFAKSWAALSGACQEKAADKQRVSGGTLAAAFVLNLLMAFVFAYFITRTRSLSVVDAAKKAVLVWGGFFVPVLASGVLWARKPLKLFLIKAGHYLAVLLAISAIVVTFR